MGSKYLANPFRLGLASAFPFMLSFKTYLIEIAVFIIDRHFNKAGVFSLIGALLAFMGLIHAPALSFGAATDFAVGYIIMGAFFFYYNWYNAKKDIPVLKTQTGEGKAA